MHVTEIVRIDDGSHYAQICPQNSMNALLICMVFMPLSHKFKSIYQLAN